MTTKDRQLTISADYISEYNDGTTIRRQTGVRPYTSVARFVTTDKARRAFHPPQLGPGARGGRVEGARGTPRPPPRGAAGRTAAGVHRAAAARRRRGRRAGGRPRTHSSPRTKIPLLAAHETRPQLASMLTDALASCQTAAFAGVAAPAQGSPFQKAVAVRVPRSRPSEPPGRVRRRRPPFADAAPPAPAPRPGSARSDGAAAESGPGAALEHSQL